MNCICSVSCGGQGPGRATPIRQCHVFVDSKEVPSAKGDPLQKGTDKSRKQHVVMGGYLA